MGELSLNGAIHAAVYHLETKLLSLPVIAIQAQHFADGAAPWLALNMDDEVDGLANLSLYVLIGRLLVASHHKIPRISQGILHDDLIASLAKDDSDAGAVACLAQLVVK